MTKITKSLFWSLIDRLSVQGLQFILGIIIARLIAPSAFGVVVMVQVFIAFAQVFIDSGFKDALIQKADRTDEDYHTVFIFNLGLAILLYLLMFILAPFIAKFYNMPMLTSLTRVISLNLIFSSLSITQLVKLTVALDFKTQTKARFISAIISGGIGVFYAHKGLEVWALVIQSVVNTFLTSLLLMSLSRWIPKLIFNIQSFKQLFRFGSKLLLSNLLTTTYIQITNLIIGKFYSSAQLAYYERGFHYSQYPSTNISGLISRVTYPLLCKCQNDRTKLIDTYNKYLHFSCYCIFPFMTILAVLSKPLILIVLTEKWIEMAPLFSIFCGVFFFYPIIENGVILLNAIGRSDVNLKMVIIKRIIAFAILAVTLFISVKAVALGLLLSNTCEAIITFITINKVMHISISKQLKPILDITLASMLSAGVALGVSLLSSNAYFQLFVGGASGIITLIILTYIFKMREKDYLNNIPNLVFHK